MKIKSFSSLLLCSFVIFTLLISSIFAGQPCFAAADSPAADLAGAARLTIMHTNDIHARVREGDGMGYAKIAAIIQEIKRSNPNTLVLDAGDTFHGQTIATLNQGESIVSLMNDLGYDAMTPGNHDFNYGYERLAQLNDLANFPILSANIIKEDGSSLFDPYVILEKAGLKIGIFGLSTPETTYKTNPKNVKGLNFTDPVEAAKATVGELKDKTDLIIALSHLGMDAASVDTSIKVAQEVEGIDLIIDGHSHTVLEHGQKVGDTLIVSTGEYGKNLGIVDIYYKAGQIGQDGQKGKIAGVEARLISKEQAAEIAEDQAIVSLIDSLETGQADMINEVVGKTAAFLEGDREKVRKGETNLGNMITDAMVYLTGADCALTNGGGIRASIDAGDITKGEVITVLPFGNYIVTLKVTGAEIKAALENGVKAYPEPSGGFPHVSGIKYTIDVGRPAGDRVEGITVNGQPLDLNKEYLLATNNFTAAGGDEYTMFADNKIINEYETLDEALLAYIQEQETVSTAVGGRIAVQETKPEPNYYIVQPGDRLAKIAKKFGTTWQRLQEYNHLQNPNLIFPGQRIVLNQGDGSLS